MSLAEGVLILLRVAPDAYEDALRQACSTLFPALQSCERFVVHCMVQPRTPQKPLSYLADHDFNMVMYQIMRKYAIPQSKIGRAHV